MVGFCNVDVKLGPVQLQVVPPVDVKLSAVPTQGLLAAAVTVGGGVIVIVATAEREQPVVVPVTVYDVAPGVTVIGLVVAPPDHK